MHALCAYVRVAIVSGTVILAVAPCGHSQSESNHQGAPRLHRQRLATTDLELNGDLKGAPRGATRYISREFADLATGSYTVTDDSNFKGPTEVSGVLLEEVMKALAVSAKADMAVAVRRPLSCALSAALSRVASSATGVEDQWTPARELAQVS